MEDKLFCPQLEAEEFCPRCSITWDILEAFKELLTEEDPNPMAHVIASPHAEAIAQAWIRIATRCEHPGIGTIMLTWNANFIVVSELPSD